MTCIYCFYLISLSAFPLALSSIVPSFLHFFSHYFLLCILPLYTIIYTHSPHAVEAYSGVSVPHVSGDDACDKCTRMSLDCAMYVVGACITLPTLGILLYGIASCITHPKENIEPLAIFTVGFFFQLGLMIYAVSRYRAITAITSTASVSSARHGGQGAGPSAPTLATAIFIQASTERGGDGGGGASQTEVKTATAVSTFSTTTSTASVTSPASVSLASSMRNAINGISSVFTAPLAADGAYTSLSSDESVHGSPSPMNIVTGVPVPAPVTAQQQGTTNWI